MFLVYLVGDLAVLRAVTILAFLLFIIIIII